MVGVDGYGCAHKLVGLLWTKDWPIAETSNSKSVTLIRDIHVPAGLKHTAVADPSLRPPATAVSVEDTIDNKLFFSCLAGMVRQ